jgi:hypothetical protein
VVQNPGGSAVKLRAGYTVIDAQGIDLAVRDSDLWFDPPNPQTGETAQIGLNIHRSGGSDSVAARASFVLGEPASGAPLGEAVTRPLEVGNDVIGTAVVTWTPGTPGEYMVSAVVDPQGTTAESSEANNTAHWSITVLPPAAEDTDQQPPRIDMLVVAGGSQVSRTATVSVTVTASDEGGSGLASLYLTERVYSNAARQWVVLKESGWVPFVNNQTIGLSPTGGGRYIQVWVADAAGNRTPTGEQRLVNFVPANQAIWEGQVHVYRMALAAGQALEARLQVANGDADLYLWDAGGTLVSYSNQAGEATDLVLKQSASGGMYQVEVFGYTDSVYQLSLQVQTAEQTQQAIGGSSAKPLPAHPVVTVQQTPASKQGLPIPVRRGLYLPIVEK